MSRLRVRPSFVFAVLACAAVPANAQVIRGTLVDDGTLERVGGATVHLRAEDGRALDRTLTDALGIFYFDVEIGPYRLAAERIGFQPTESFLFHVEVYDTLDVEFRIAQQAVMLSPLVVSVGLPSGRELFEKRVETEDGFFFTPEMVDSLRPETYASEIFRHAERTVMHTWRRVRGEDGNHRVVTGFRTTLGREGCLHWIVDHTPVPEPFWASSVWGVPPLMDLQPEDLVAIEMYRAWHEVPEDFREGIRIRTVREGQAMTRINRKECGIVIIWTRDGWEG